MTDLLLRLFVKNRHDTASPAVRASIGSLAGIVGIVANLLLFAGKLLVGTLTGSVSITADAMNNLSDASSAIVTLIGFRLAGKPADDDHPYGHARYEYLSGLAVAAMIIVIGFEMGKTAVEKIFAPTPVALSLPALGVLLASVCVKLWLSVFNRKLSQRIGSAALTATAADSRNDALATAAVLLTALTEQFLNWRVDGFVGLAVALFILWSGWGLAKQTISPLLGEAASPELRSLIVDYIARQPKVLGYHDLMVHDYGPGQRFASIHVEMDMREDPLFCHELIDDMERECLRSHNIHLVIHHDPVVTDDPELNDLRRRVRDFFREKHEKLLVHDFRILRLPQRTDLLFDVAMPRQFRGQEELLQKELEAMLNRNSPVEYRAVITFDPLAFHQE